MNVPSKGEVLDCYRRLVAASARQGWTGVAAYLDAIGAYIRAQPVVAKPSDLTPAMIDAGWQPHDGSSNPPVAIGEVVELYLQSEPALEPVTFGPFRLEKPDEWEWTYLIAYRHFKAVKS